MTGIVRFSIRCNDQSGHMRATNTRNRSLARVMAVPMRGFETTALLLLFALGGCDNHSNVPPSEPKCTTDAQPGVLMPLAVGNYWDYDVFQSSGRLSDSLRFEVLSMIRLNDGILPPVGYVTNWHKKGRPLANRSWVYANTRFGLRIVGAVDTDTVFAEFTTYPYPASSRTTFYSYSYSRDPTTTALVRSDSTLYTLVATDSVAITPAGHFATYVYKFFIPPPVEDVLWGDFVYQQYSPGIGLVALNMVGESSDFPGAPQLRHVLTDFCLMN